MDGFGVNLDLTDVLAGSDATPFILAVEPAGPARIAVYRRDSSSVGRDDVDFHPWLLAGRSKPWAALRTVTALETLDGDLPLRYLVRFANWSAYQDAARAGRESREQLFLVNSLVDQYLVMSGRTLFKGMRFEDVRRLQLDIETTGLDPSGPENRIIIATLRSPEGDVTLLDAKSEEALLVDLTAVIRSIDPDVIEGHNIFNFDLPFISQRAARWSVPLDWGRDNSVLRLAAKPQRYRVGPLSHTYQPAYVTGRHIIDTYQQIQRYDIGGHLTSYGLKPSVEALGLTRADREFIPGHQIAEVWRTDPQRLIRYAMDDVLDVDLLSRLTLPTEFYQTQLLPRSFQQSAVAGPGGKINDLMLREYLNKRQSLPLPGASRDYPGGHAELLATGVFSPVVKCDVESLYPSLMLSESITSSRDSLGVFLPMLGELTRRRLHAKNQMRVTSGEERAVWDGLQSSFKRLINSFYGYLGFGGALFNDYDAATAVTLSGQRVIKAVVASLGDAGATPIEVDTDGVYFVPPADVITEDEEIAYIERLGSQLPDAIRLAHDGRYQAMLSLHVKNYALLDYDDRIVLKGSALRSRRTEPFIRDFLITATRAFMRDDRSAARDAYFALAERIRERHMEIGQISQWAMIHDETSRSQPRLKRLLDRLPTAISGGERVLLYEREDGELALADEYSKDENVGYLLKRLSDSAGRFAPLFDSPKALAAFFPLISARTDLSAARVQEASTQLSMF